MSDIVIKPLPLTAERFVPFGDVIDTAAAAATPMNAARFDRYDDLARVDCKRDANGHVSIGIVRSRTPTRFPHRFDTVERHPLASQAFMPLDRFAFVIVVAPAAESVTPDDLRAFVTNGRQGVNYHRGTWHMPLVAAREGQAFLVVDRRPEAGNCEELVFDRSVILNWSPDGA
jgi:ureidoglycolate lyase